MQLCSKQVSPEKTNTFLLARATSFTEEEEENVLQRDGFSHFTFATVVSRNHQRPVRHRARRQMDPRERVPSNRDTDSRRVAPKRRQHLSRIETRVGRDDDDDDDER